MSIPIFSTDYLLGPGAEGAITPSTARLLMEQGRALGQQIEKTAAQAIAKAQAPAMAQGYADAFSRISQGDLSGFGTLGQIGAKAVGNPFLSSMHKDATETAIRIGSNFQQTRLQDERLKAQLELETYQQGKIDQRQANQINAQEAASDRSLVRQEQSNLDIEHRQETNAVVKERFDREEEYRKKAQAYNRKLEEGIDPGPAPERPAVPDLPPPRARPVPPRSRVAPPGYDNLPQGGNRGVPSSQIVNESSGLFNAQGGIGIPPQKVQDPFSQEQAVASAAQPQAAAEPAAIPAAVPTQTTATPVVAPSKKERKMVQREMPDGKQMIEFEEPGRGTPDQRITIGEAGDKVSMVKKGKPDPRKELLEAIDVLNTDRGLMKWAKVQAEQKKNVTFKPVLGEKNQKPTGIYHAFAVSPDGTEELYSKKEEKKKKNDKVGTDFGKEENTVTYKPIPVAKEVVDKFYVPGKLLQNELKGQVSIYPKLSDEQKDFARKRAAERIASGEYTLDAANKELSHVKAKTLTDDEVEEIALKLRKKQDFLSSKGPSPDKYLNPLPSPDELVRNLTTY